MFRKGEKQRATARHSVSDFSKLGAVCSNVSSMAKLGTKPFGEGTISTKRYHEWAVICSHHLDLRFLYAFKQV